MPKLEPDREQPDREPDPAAPPLLPRDVLLHVCCGPCAIWPVRELRAAGCGPTGFWYNPNIQPYREYLLRLQSCRTMAAAAGLRLEVRDEYALEEHLARVLPLPAGPERCAQCYRLRLAAAAQKAGQLGFAAFSTTLLVSPHQHHALVRSAGEEAAAEHGLTFVYQDWRAGFSAGRVESRALGLHHQGYCGCVLSEAERYAPPATRPPWEGVR